MVAQKVRFAASFSCVPREASGHDVHAHVKTRARVVRARSTWSEACRAPPLINFFFSWAPKTRIPFSTRRVEHKPGKDDTGEEMRPPRGSFHSRPRGAQR